MKSNRGFTLIELMIV
ncbi:prepilin-type N-terminal cleavage/methylation domain-containing protein, partial [Pseudomonas aeruginosa]